MKLETTYTTSLMPALLLRLEILLYDPSSFLPNLSQAPSSTFAISRSPSSSFLFSSNLNSLLHFPVISSLPSTSIPFYPPSPSLPLSLPPFHPPSTPPLSPSPPFKTLSWLQIELPKHGFSFRTLLGSMTMANRAKALADFQACHTNTIFALYVLTVIYYYSVCFANNHI